MFEPGDRVTIKGDETGKVWMVVTFPWKQWRDMVVRIEDEKGEPTIVNVNSLSKFEDKPRHMSCNGDFCEIVREEMRLE